MWIKCSKEDEEEWKVSELNGSKGSIGCGDLGTNMADGLGSSWGKLRVGFKNLYTLAIRRNLK